jgi:hypothetical protein
MDDVRTSRMNIVFLGQKSAAVDEYRSLKKANRKFYDTKSHSPQFQKSTKSKILFISVHHIQKTE